MGELGGALVDDVPHLRWCLVHVVARRHRVHRSDAERSPLVERLLVLATNRHADRSSQSRNVGKWRRAAADRAGVRLAGGAVRRTAGRVFKATAAPRFAEAPTCFGGIK